MAPHHDFLGALSASLGQALAFADDVSERQQLAIGSPSTRATLNANARSFLIGALRKARLDRHELLERNTDFNKVVVQDHLTQTRYWLKSETAVKFTFERPVDRLFPVPSALRVLTFLIDGHEVMYRHAPISRLKNKKYQLDSELVSAGRFPLGGSFPPGTSPSAWAISSFDPGPQDTFDDVFNHGDEGGEQDGEASA